jgi:hypothetical protein
LLAGKMVLLLHAPPLRIVVQASELSLPPGKARLRRRMSAAPESVLLANRGFECTRVCRTLEVLGRKSP